MTAVTIVMYHYVRPREGGRYPGLKVRSVEEFEGQLDYIVRHYQVCAMSDVIAAVHGREALPSNACLLTFDDGFLDHYTVVFPRLVERGLPGSFYPPVAAIEGRHVLDTHKIQIVLAVTTDHRALAQRLLAMVDEYRAEWTLPDAATLRARHMQPSRFDTPEVVLVKRLLQRGLPGPVRASLTQRLFEECVGVDEATVAGELYMDLPQLRTMVRQGMEVGGHGATHVWLDSLAPVEQEDEIAKTAAFLQRVHGAPAADWVMCYPFGGYGADTLRLLGQVRCALGLTTRVDVATDLGSPLELPRLDTNDLPSVGTAPASAWTLRVADPLAASGRKH
jgi:peptidoglycan/xylan/chitin deacetylase (PgdA/CDA1 family)